MKDRNFEQRIQFINYWTDFMKNNTNKVWSSQQSAFINSVLKNANQDVELYLNVKKQMK